MDGNRSCSKNSLDCKDRISDLPEGVLSNILSRLPTEDAVRTSVLSRKWEYKWTSIYNLTFYDRKRDVYSHKRKRLGLGNLVKPQKLLKPKKRPRKTDFMNFVDRVLALRNNSTLKEFRLLFSDYKCDQCRMKSWISAALSANVQSLCISYQGDVLFPRWFFTSDSLTKLELKLKFKIQKNICYSNLRTLDIHNVEFHNDNTLPSSHLMFWFPVLEEFLSSGCKWWNVNLVKIEAPRLATFEMTDCAFECVNDGLNDCKIEICGTSLAKLKCSVNKSANFCFSNPSTIVNACLRYWKSYRKDDLNPRREIASRASMILARFSAFIRFLELSSDLVQVHADAKPTCPLPIFGELTHLKVYSASKAIKCDAALIDFLKMAPALESLTFSGTYSSKAAENHDQIEMPGDFLSLLKIVRLEYSYSPSPMGSPLVKFLLRNAVELKELLIYSRHQRHEVDEFKDQLLKCSRGSNHVSILSICPLDSVSSSRPIIKLRSSIAFA